jgi:hypothetical protein
VKGCTVHIIKYQNHTEMVQNFEVQIKYEQLLARVFKLFYTVQYQSQIVFPLITKISELHMLVSDYI